MRRRGYIPGGTGEALGVLGRIRGAYLIQFPSGRWGFRGRVPIALSYTYKDGSPLSDEDVRNVQQHGAGLFKKRIQNVVFETAEDALDAAREIGIEPENAGDYE